MEGRVGWKIYESSFFLLENGCWKPTQFTMFTIILPYGLQRSIFSAVTLTLVSHSHLLLLNEMYFEVEHSTCGVIIRFLVWSRLVGNLADRTFWVTENEPMDISGLNSLFYSINECLKRQIKMSDSFLSVRQTGVPRTVLSCLVIVFVGSTAMF